MGKTRDHFKKIRDTMGTFHAKMGSIMDRNGRDLTEEEGADEHLLSTYYVLAVHKTYLYLFSCSILRAVCEDSLLFTEEKSKLRELE